MTPEQISKFEEDGFVVIDNFLTTEEIELLKADCAELIDKMEPEEHKSVFITGKSQKPDEYFLNSAHEIRYFFEKDALDEKGNLLVEKQNSLNKIGHALHKHNHFKKITFSEKVKNTANDLGFLEPVVIQSMYIFKNPKVGGEVVSHQDATYLYTDPVKLLGYWIPLEDATIENGCLWVLPGSHKGEVYKRFIRDSEDKTSLITVVDTPLFEDNELIPVVVPKGSCVLIHGKVLHRSEKNLSDKPRPAYTFHIIETNGTKYSTENWLKPSKEENPFLPLYTTTE